MKYAFISGIDYKRIGSDWYASQSGLGHFTGLKTHEIMDMAFSTENSTYW